jgi:signal transduction histidine kinase
MEEDRVYQTLSQEIVRGLGFDVMLVVLKQGESSVVKVAAGCENVQKLTAFLKDASALETYLSQRGIVSSAGTVDIPQGARAFFEKDLKMRTFFACALRSKAEIMGLVVMGSTQETAVTAGIKELAEVFSTQLAQSIENIRMFEQTFNAQRELERRVRERTGELQNTMRDLTEANKRKTEFVSAVSHEFRTPLTSIKGYAALLAGGKFGELPAEISTRLNRINEQADALVGMINDLLDIARIESGRVQVQMQRIDFCEAVRTQADMFFPQLNEKQLNLHLDIPEHATVDGDKQMLQRVVMNLLSNAVKFTPSGRNIYLAVKEQGAQYRVSVKDEGIGIPAADLENVFKEFFRVNTAEHRAVKGTGLGLSLVVNIVRAHKGKVWVESDTGKGAEFIFLLPKETATADAVAG